MDIKLTLKAARVNASMTQCDVSQLMGVSRQTVSSWESGKTSPRLYQINRLCELYKVSPDQISL